MIHHNDLKKQFNQNCIPKVSDNKNTSVQVPVKKFTKVEKGKSKFTNISKPTTTRIHQVKTLTSNETLKALAKKPNFNARDFDEFLNSDDDVIIEPSPSIETITPTRPKIKETKPIAHIFQQARKPVMSNKISILKKLTSPEIPKRNETNKQAKKSMTFQVKDSTTSRSSGKQKEPNRQIHANNFKFHVTDTKDKPVRQVWKAKQCKPKMHEDNHFIFRPNKNFHDCNNFSSSDNFHLNFVLHDQNNIKSAMNDYGFNYNSCIQMFSTSDKLKSVNKKGPITKWVPKHV